MPASDRPAAAPSETGSPAPTPRAVGRRIHGACKAAAAPDPVPGTRTASRPERDCLARLPSREPLCRHRSSIVKPGAARLVEFREVFAIGAGLVFPGDPTPLG